MNDVDRIGATDTKVLLAVVEGARLYSTLMDRTGLNRGQLKRSLDRLRDRDLVTWDPKKKGSIRALVTAR